jgi:hypothetical protein
MTLSPTSSRTETVTFSPTPTINGSETFTVTPIGSPTDTPVVFVLGTTPTYTQTITRTFTITPVSTPVSIQVEILDSNLNVVGHVIIYGGHGSIQSVSLGSTTFIPEIQHQLLITANQGAVGNWNGVGLDNKTLLPNGFYHLEVTQAGQAPITVSFWIQHTQYSEGSVVLAYNPVSAGKPLILIYTFPTSVSLVVRVYNIAGELICLGNGEGSSGRINMPLKTSGGNDAAAGIYLIQVRGQTVNGGAEILRSIKAAVVR